MVPFAGWDMPVQYEGVIPEHIAVRTRAGVFDVSHMGQVHVDGPNAQAFLQSVLSNDIDRVYDGGAQYTLLTTETGGIVDDLIVYRLSHGCFLLVVNAGNREAAYEWLKEREPRGVEVRDASDEYALVAVQGPSSLELLGLDEAPAFTHAMGSVAGIETMVCRTGYTGEKGVELLCPAEDGVPLWTSVLERGVAPCGLGARDTLRLEVCYPLHGNDITQDTDAISAGLGWVCALDTEFTGADALRRVKEQGPERRLVAFVMDEKAIPRQGMAIAGGGEVTSGTHSPSLDVGIGMGYVPSARAATGTELEIDVRGKPRRARVVQKPIYKKER
jgi:aminomethyltransferase